MNIDKAIEATDLMITEMEEDAKFIVDKSVKAHTEKRIKALETLKMCGRKLIDGSLEIGVKRIG